MLKLNRQTLVVKPGKDYTEIVFIGDVHLGSKYCNAEAVWSMVDYCVDNSLYVFCMGDILEAASRYSVGSGVYEQTNPQEQIDLALELLRPLADKKLILGYLTGNHEERVTKATGIDISKYIAKELKVPYLGYAGWSLLYVGEQSYVLYTHHGASSATTLPSKIKSLIALSENGYADIIAMGHVHETWAGAIEKEYVNRKRKTVEIKRVELIITGHYLNYDGYARTKAYSMGKQGSPKLKLFSDKFDVHTSI